MKGAGLTAFSRFADGRAVIRSSVREYLASEALHHLGIPTTRALTLTIGDEPVRRERIERAAIVTRIAPSFARFGTFEFFHHLGRFEELRLLADYVIARFFPHLATIADDRERHASYAREVVERTARLIAQWQAVGFAHGVLNTDNMSILGLTLDYGPYGFIDAYDPGFVCNHSDELGRYAFDQQPRIGRWNCSAFIAAMTSLIAPDDAPEVLAAYDPAFATRFAELMRAKLGLVDARDEDAALIDDLLDLLKVARADYTIFFRALGRFEPDGIAARELDPLFADRGSWAAWLQRYRARVANDSRTDAGRRAAMERVNPAYVLRNHLAQEAIVAAETGDASVLDQLWRALRSPFDEEAGHARYAAAPPPWASELTVSCSS